MLQHQEQQKQPTLPTLPAMHNNEAAIEHAYGTVGVSSGDSEAYVMPLLANLRKIKLLRHLTAEQLRTEAAGAEIFGLLRMCLTENSELHWKAKIVAAWALSKADLNEAQRNRTVAQLYDIVGKYGESGSASWVSRIWNAGARVMKWVLPIASIVGLIALISAAFYSSPEMLPPPLITGANVLFGLGAVLGAVLTPFVVPYSLMVDADHYHEVRAAAVRALRALGGVESLDLIAKMALESSPMTSGPARGTLAELLKKLKPEHYGTLPASLVPDLCRILKYEAAWLSASTENHTLALRVIAGLEKIGDGYAAAVVEKLLKGSITPQLRAAMQAALPTLQERRRNENAREMLLRHSTMPPAAPTELLRPVVETVSQSGPVHACPRRQQSCRNGRHTMRITPRRSTERIAAEFLPELAEMEWIGSLKVKSGDVLLRNIARSCFTGIRPTDDEAQCALNVLNRPSEQQDWNAEALAIWILGFAKPNFVFTEWAQQSVISAAFPDNSFYQRSVSLAGKTTRLLLPLTVFTGSLILPLLLTINKVYEESLLLFFVLVSLGAIFGAMAGVVTGVLLTPVVTPFIAYVIASQEKQIQRAALYTLRRWNDPRFIGEVARASIKADSATMAQVQETFERLLEKLTPEHYGVMPAGTTEFLCRALEIAEERTTSLYWKPDTITLSIPYVKNLLRALEMVGNGHAAKYVRAVIAQNWNEEITRLATSVLTILSEREQDETARTTLLRHSAVPASATNYCAPPQIHKPMTTQKP